MQSENVIKECPSSSMFVMLVHDVNNRFEVTVRSIGGVGSMMPRIIAVDQRRKRLHYERKLENSIWPKLCAELVISRRFICTPYWFPAKSPHFPEVLTKDEVLRGLGRQATSQRRLLRSYIGVVSTT